jgi:hypothetical protein
MEDKIEVGEYVRTIYGEITKLKKGETASGTYLYPETKIFDGVDRTNHINYRVIKKHSKNIIDLIEEGDILRYRLNNFSASRIREVRKYRDARSFKEYLGVEGFRLEQIEIIKIATKEQFSQIEYKVEE